MQKIDMVRHALRMADGGFVGLVDGLREHPMARPSLAGGNHAVWTLGHVTFIELAVPGILFGRPHPKPEWASLFQMGSECLCDPARYPAFDDLLSAYRSARAATLALLDSVGDARLADPPAAPPPGFEAEMATVGQTLQVIAMHQMMHMGQLADVRRAVGLPRLS